MKTAIELLDEMHVKHKGRNHGDFKTTCPQCSHMRKNKTDPCLSVTIDDIGAVVFCHNCGWTEGKRYDGSANYRRSNRQAPPKVTYSGLLAKARGNWVTKPSMPHMRGSEKH